MGAHLPDQAGNLIGREVRRHPQEQRDRIPVLLHSLLRLAGGAVPFRQPQQDPAIPVGILQVLGMRLGQPLGRVLGSPTTTRKRRTSAGR